MIRTFEGLKKQISVVYCDNLMEYKIVIRLLKSHGWQESNRIEDDFKKHPIIYVHKDIAFTTLHSDKHIAGYEKVTYSDIMKIYSIERKDIRFTSIKDKVSLLFCDNKETHDKCVHYLKLNGVNNTQYSDEYEKYPHILLKNGVFSDISSNGAANEGVASPEIINAIDFLAINN